MHGLIFYVTHNKNSLKQELKILRLEENHFLHVSLMKNDSCVERWLEKWFWHVV